MDVDSHRQAVLGQDVYVPVTTQAGPQGDKGPVKHHDGRSSVGTGMSIPGARAQPPKPDAPPV